MSIRFSSRQGLSLPDAEITVRHDAPEDLRSVLVDISYESGIKPNRLRQIVCRILCVAPDRSNWSDFPNIDEEIRNLLNYCEWHKVYDVIEGISRILLDSEIVIPIGRESVYASEFFPEEINRYFRGRGIGWQLVNGQIEIRGSESFEEAILGARDALKVANRITSTTELHEAIIDLSRRPEPDVTGAVQHAMAALECVARDSVGGSNLTLGELIRRHADLFPKPLDQALEKAWGYTSETGRHLKEGRGPKFEEAELIVGVSSAVCRYLARKLAIIQ